MSPEILKLLADNPALTDAVREVIERHFNADVISERMTNEEIGQITRARVSGLEKVAAAFKDIERFRSVPDRPEGRNPAR